MVAMAKASEEYSLEEKVHQSPPLDMKDKINDGWIKGKTILITGGASGFGAGFFRRWAAAGATVIIGDINVAKGEQLVQGVKKETKNPDLHFIECNVADWKSQVSFFKAAKKLSPHGGIDTVVANAGVADLDPIFENPHDLDADDPPPPDSRILDVNLTGVVYTTHLALFYLQKNPGSSLADPKCNPADTSRDRHLLLISSAAGLLPMPGHTYYAASKHAVVGIYRSLRASSYLHGVRVNMIAPYFIDTPMMTFGAKIILAGGNVGKPEDVVEAATRFTADPRIVGRAVFVGPKLNVKQDSGGEWNLVRAQEDGEQKSSWEIYVHDLKDSDLYQR